MELDKNFSRFAWILRSHSGLEICGNWTSRLSVLSPLASYVGRVKSVKRNLFSTLSFSNPIFARIACCNFFFWKLFHTPTRHPNPRLLAWQNLAPPIRECPEETARRGKRQGGGNYIWCLHLVGEWSTPKIFSMNQPVSAEKRGVSRTLKLVRHPISMTPSWRTEWMTAFLPPFLLMRASHRFPSWSARNRLQGGRSGKKERCENAQAFLHCRNLKVKSVHPSFPRTMTITLCECDLIAAGCGVATYEHAAQVPNDLV